MIYIAHGHIYVTVFVTTHLIDHVISGNKI